MRKLFIIVLIAFGLLGSAYICNAALETPETASIYNQDQAQYLDATNIENPIRNGAYAAITSGDEKISGLVATTEEIENHTSAKIKVLQIIKNVINYALGLLSLIALIYLIYHGFMIVTAAGDDKKYKEGLAGIKFAAIALIGVGMSWIVISSIFWLITRMTGTVTKGEAIDPTLTPTTTTSATITP